MTNKQIKTEKALEILVVEDTPIHQESARILLGAQGHNVEIVGTYDDALDRISKSCFSQGPRTEEKTYDVVLTDMFYPQGRGDCLHDKSQASIEQPFGYALAQIACLKGVPYVAIVSHADHHANGIAYSMDPLNKKIQKVNDSRYCVFNYTLGLLKNDLVLGADGTPVGFSQKARDKLRENTDRKVEGVTEIEGYAVEWNAQSSANRFKQVDPSTRPQTPEKSKDWLSALIYLMTAE